MTSTYVSFQFAPVSVSCCLCELCSIIHSSLGVHYHGWVHVTLYRETWLSSPFHAQVLSTHFLILSTIDYIYIFILFNWHSWYIRHSFPLFLKIASHNNSSETHRDRILFSSFFVYIIFKRPIYGCVKNLEKRSLVLWDRVKKIIHYHYIHTIKLV